MRLFTAIFDDFWLAGNLYWFYIHKKGCKILVCNAVQCNVTKDKITKASDKIDLKLFCRKHFFN